VLLSTLPVVSLKRLRPGRVDHFSKQLIVVDTSFTKRNNVQELAFDQLFGFHAHIEQPPSALPTLKRLVEFNPCIWSTLEDSLDVVDWVYVPMPASYQLLDFSPLYLRKPDYLLHLPGTSPL